VHLRITRWCRWRGPVTENYEGDQFFVRRLGKLVATPLFLVLLIVESTDLIFAVDSIPAIFAVTNDPFLCIPRTIRHSGLILLYFLLAGVVDKFII
jgi:tellurite resistance protein TerC